MFSLHLRNRHHITPQSRFSDCIRECQTRVIKGVFPLEGRTSEKTKEICPAIHHLDTPAAFLSPVTHYTSLFHTMALTLTLTRLLHNNATLQPRLVETPHPDLTLHETVLIRSIGFAWSTPGSTGKSALRSSLVHQCCYLKGTARASRRNFPALPTTQRIKQR